MQQRKSSKLSLSCVLSFEYTSMVQCWVDCCNWFELKLISDFFLKKVNKLIYFLTLHLCTNVFILHGV